MLQQLSLIGKDERGGITRLAASDADKEARDLVIQWMKEEALIIHIDRIGNIIAVRDGIENSKPVMTGSHIDTVVSGGMYDGCYGVLAGLEVIKTLNEFNIKTRYPIALAVFTNEEGIRYTPDMMGSLVFSGGLKAEKAMKSIGVDGSILENELKRIGYMGDLQVGALIPSSYVELHIEQGPILEIKGLNIGVVENLQGISWKEIILTGESNHAGTTPLIYRKDAGLAAAKIINYLSDLCSSVGGSQVATCGKVIFEPNVINVVPGKVKMTIDLRNSSEEGLKHAENLLHSFLEQLAEYESIDIKINQLVRLQPVQFDGTMTQIIERVNNRLGLTYLKMTSGAGHDAQMLARICPTAMIFVPSKGGISHNPNEYTSTQDIENGANVLLNTILELSNKI